MATVDKGLEKAGIKSRTDEYRRVCPGSVFEILNKLDKAMLKFDEILGSSGLSEFSSLGYSSQSSNLSLLETGLDVLGEVPGLIVDEMTEADTNFKSGIEDALSMLQAVFISEISLGTDATMEIDEKAAALRESIEQKERTLNLHNGGLLKAAREEYQAEVEILRKQEAALKQYEMQAKGGNPSALEQSRHARKEIEEQRGKLAEKLMKYADLGFELSDLDEDISKEVLKAIDDRLTEYTSERVTGSLCDYVYRNCEGATSEERIRNGLSAVTETQGCGDLNYVLDYLKHIRGCEIESVESQRTVYSEGVTNQFAFHFMIEDDLYMHEMPKWWMKKKLRIPATVQITEENVEDVYCNDKLRDYYFDSYAVVDMISGMSTKATSSEGDIMDAWWVQERMLSEHGICKDEIYEEWADLNYGAMYDAVNKNGTVRGVKYAMSNWFDIGDHTTQEGRYVVYDNTQTSEYELAVEGYLGKYKHSEDYYNKIWGKDVKINRENQLMVYLTKDREEEKKEELTEAERTLLKEVRETNYYEGFGVCEYMDMNLLAKFMDEEMNADGLSKSARVEGSTIYIECTVYDEFGQETKKSYTMDFSDCRDVFGSRYVSIDECTRMLYDFATVRYEEGWYTDIIVDDCLYSTIAKEQAEAYAREEIRHGVDEQQAREDYQQMVKELMITEDTTRMQLDTYMNERVRNVEVFNKAKDVVVAATDIAVLMICLSNPGSALAAAATIIDGGIGVLDGSVRVSQGEKGAGYFEIALSSLSLGGGIYDATKLYKANQTAVKVVKAADAADEELKIEGKILETADEAKLDDAAKVKPKVVNETTTTKVAETSYGKSSGNLTEGSTCSVNKTLSEMTDAELENLGYKRYSDGSIRDSKGHFAGNSGTIPGTPGVDVVEKYLKDNNYVIKGREISVKSSDGKLRRYDIVVTQDGTCYGIEVKSGTATRTKQQIQIDNELISKHGLNTTGQNAINSSVKRIDNVKVIYVDSNGKIIKIE